MQLATFDVISSSPSESSPYIFFRDKMHACYRICACVRVREYMCACLRVQSMCATHTLHDKH